MWFGGGLGWFGVFWGGLGFFNGPHDGYANSLSPYLTGLQLFCDNWRQTSRVGRKAVSKQSPVIRNLLACVAKWRKVARILNMFKNFMRQNSSQNGRKVIAGVSNPS